MCVRTQGMGFFSKLLGRFEGLLGVLKGVRVGGGYTVWN